VDLIQTIITLSTSYVKSLSKLIAFELNKRLSTWLQI